MIRKLLLATVSLALIATILETYFRFEPLTRVQRVMKLQNQNNLEIVDGVPLWHSVKRSSTLVANRSCLRELHDRPDVLFVGDSIFYGVFLEPTKTIAPIVQQMLVSSLGRPSCVVNLSQPGYTFQNEEVVIRRAVEEFHPRVLVLEIWANSVHKFALTDESAYNFGTLQADELGFPNLGVPLLLNQKLFSWSATWRHVSLGLAKSSRVGPLQQWENLVAGGLEPLRVWLDERDTTLVLAFATSMSTPLSEERQKEHIYSVVMEWAEEHAVSQIYFLDVMASEKVEDMSIDTCCHLSARGTEKVAEALEPILVEILSGDEK
jgi:hypothetical protein